ncbi:MAG: hypothetical protein N2C14_19870 [Planctomycetales bacterium]
MLCWRELKAEQPIQFFTHLFDSNLSLLDIVDSNFVVIDQPLNEVMYGLTDAALGGDEFAMVDVSQNRRGQEYETECGWEKVKQF